MLPRDGVQTGWVQYARSKIVDVRASRLMFGMAMR
jgi:hypothetical protein